MIIKMDSGREVNHTPFVNWLKSLWHFETLLALIAAFSGSVYSHARYVR